MEEAFAGAVGEGAVFLVDWLQVHWLPEGAGFDIYFGEGLLKIGGGETGFGFVDNDGGEPEVITGVAAVDSGWFAEHADARDILEKVAVAQAVLAAGFNHRFQTG